MHKIIIIGAGPVGLFLAHHLLSRGGYQVAVYECRPDPRQVESSNRHTFPISVQARGLRAIRTIPGLEAALEEKGMWSSGTVLHSRRGKTRQIDRKLPLLLVDRNQLTGVLLQHLSDRHDQALLTIQFDCACTDVDPDGQIVMLHPVAGKPFTARFDYLVGADGVNSQVRDVRVAKADMQCEQSVIPDAYQSLFVRNRNSDGSVKLAPDRIHSWTIGRNKRVLMAPLPDDWLHGVVLFPLGKNPIADCADAAAVHRYFQDKCPVLAGLMTLEDAEALRQCPVSQLLTVTCDRMAAMPRYRMCRRSCNFWISIRMTGAKRCLRLLFSDCRKFTHYAIYPTIVFRNRSERCWSLSYASRWVKSFDSGFPNLASLYPWN
ncbi:MAG: FAD-dependent oxidoreductase [Elainellaceae cyanobacterium]